MDKTTLKMVIFICVLFSVQSLCTCLTAAFVNITWEDMSGFKRIVLFIAVLGNWTTLLMAYFSKTFARMEPQLGSVISNGDNGGNKEIKTTERVTTTQEVAIRKEVVPPAAVVEEAPKPEALTAINAQTGVDLLNRIRGKTA
jgi:hypothetical protein